jgi:hypothetical protein
LEPKVFRQQCELFGGAAIAELPLMSEIVREKDRVTLVIGGADTISKLRG